MSAFRQSGHQRRGGAVRSIAEVGANAKTITAMIATGTLQMTKLHCQLPPAIGKTNGNINTTGKISPTSRPFV
jgi:hypothetical protein